MTDTISSNYDPKLTHNEVGATISHLGIKKANTRPWQLFLLGLLAGIYISFGSHFFLVAMEQGMGRIVAGACFSVGLVLVVQVQSSSLVIS
jgi:formate/nitrite transporter FocA (FNT family)